MQLLPHPVSFGNPTKLKCGCDTWSSPCPCPRFKGLLVQPLSWGQDTLPQWLTAFFYHVCHLLTCCRDAELSQINHFLSSPNTWPHFSSL